jgi:MHS family alpha-ketoglutarate permease-like MFS transporter
VLTVVGLTMGGTVAFYLHHLCAEVHGQHRRLVEGDATLVSALVLAGFMVLQPLVGACRTGSGGGRCCWPSGCWARSHRAADAAAVTHDFWTGFALLMAALVVVSGYPRSTRW